MRIHPFIKALAPLAIVASLALSLGACDSNANSSAGSDSQQTTTQTGPQTPAIQGVVSLDQNDYVVFDGSGSMGSCVDRQGNEYLPRNGCQPKIDGGRQAMLAVLGKIPDEHVNLGLYVFDDNERGERVKLSGSNRAEILSAVNAIQAGGSTPLGPAIKVGARALIEQYHRQLGYGTYRLIVVTDGMPDSAYEVDDALKFIRESGVPIEMYTIGFGMNDPDHPLRKASVSFTPAYNGAEVKDALQQAVSESSTFDSVEFKKKK